MNRRTFVWRGGALLGVGLLGCSQRKADPDEGGPTPSDPSDMTDMNGMSDMTGMSETTTSSTDTGSPTDTGVEEVGTALFIPPELFGTEIDGRKVFDLVVQYGTHTFIPGTAALTLGYNGDLLGPTLRATRGDALTIRVTNQLSEETTTHWHGAHLPASADGGPHQVIAPGATWVSEWVVNQPGCTNWYHPHREGTSAEQVYMGLAGLFILDDPAHDALDLPKRYGVDDIPLVIQDRRFRDGELEYDLSMMDENMGFQGDTLIVNGDISPYVEVEAKQIRFRILNGSNAGIYRFALDDGSSFQLIGVDNSLLEAPTELTSVLMSPGERAEIVVDFTGRLGDAVVLFDQRSGRNVLQIRVTSKPKEITTVPATLLSLAKEDPAEVVRTRPFVLSMAMMGGPKINGVSMDMEVINEVVVVDELELWELRNTSMMTHNFHMHATYFEVLTRNGGAPDPHEAGYKDTVRLAPNDTVEVLVRHRDYTDPDTPYMYHCHILEHEDRGMMGQFVVMDPPA